MTEVLIHLSHWETRRSIPVLLKGVGRWWIHNLTRSCTSSSEWNRRPRMSFFRSPKMWKSHGERYGMYGGCWKCFPAKSLKLIPHHFGSMGTGVIMQKDDFVRQHSRAFWLYGASQHPQPLKKNHASLLFFACFHFQCWTNTLYTTLTSRAIKKQLCGPVRFHYACLLPYRWQYRYISVASFCEECVLWRVFSFHLTAPYRSRQRAYSKTMKYNWTSDTRKTATIVLKYFFKWKTIYKIHSVIAYNKFRVW